MNKDKYVFAQLVAFLDNNKFRHLVDKYDGNRYVKNFTCWNQLMALMFGQLCNRESLRDVVVALETHQSKCYHLGMGRNPIAKTTFATRNSTSNHNKALPRASHVALYLIEILHQTTTSGLILIDKVLLTGCLPL